jgi:hypothetical protein
VDTVSDRDNKDACSYGDGGKVGYDQDVFRMTRVRKKDGSVV